MARTLSRLQVAPLLVAGLVPFAVGSGTQSEIRSVSVSALDENVAGASTPAAGAGALAFSRDVVGRCDLM